MYEVIYTYEDSRGYPALRCRGCPERYHLTQAVRWNEDDRAKEISAAKARGWVVSHYGAVNWCPSCKPKPQQRTLMQRIRDWYWARQRRADLDILWPVCKKRAPSIDHAKAAFMTHASLCPCWIDHYGYDGLVHFVDGLS